MENKDIINLEDKKFIIDFLYEVNGYYTFSIKVKSENFSGQFNFCISKKELCFYIETLSEMYDKLNGSCQIKDNDSDAYIKIEIQKFGHLIVCGQIGGSHENHYMKFKFLSDQTILDRLINYFRLLPRIGN